MNRWTRLRINEVPKGVQITIRPREGRLLGILAAIFLLGFALKKMLADGHFDPSGLSDFIAQWFPMIALVVVFNLWQFLWKQKICIYRQEIRINNMIGSLGVGDIKIIISNLIDYIQLEEREYQGKGRKLVKRTLSFMSNEQVVARSMELSKSDAVILLEGPFKDFKKK